MANGIRWLVGIAMGLLLGLSGSLANETCVDCRSLERTLDAQTDDVPDTLLLTRGHWLTISLPEDVKVIAPSAHNLIELHVHKQVIIASWEPRARSLDGQPLQVGVGIKLSSNRFIHCRFEETQPNEPMPYDVVRIKYEEPEPEPSAVEQIEAWRRGQRELLKPEVETALNRAFEYRKELDLQDLLLAGPNYPFKPRRIPFGATTIFFKEGWHMGPYCYLRFEIKSHAPAAFVVDEIRLSHELQRLPIDSLQWKMDKTYLLMRFDWSLLDDDHEIDVAFCDVRGRCLSVRVYE